MSEYAIDDMDDDRQCLDEMITSTLPLIERIARRMAASCGKLMITADDLQQEGCLALIKAANKYNPGMGPFGAYAGVVAQNAMLNVIRKERTRFEHRADGGMLSLVDDAGDRLDIAACLMNNEAAMTPEQILIRKESIDEVRNALDAVPQRDRAYLWYRFEFDEVRERSMAKTTEHFHLSERAGKKTEREALMKVEKKLKAI